MTLPFFESHAKLTVMGTQALPPLVPLDNRGLGVLLPSGIKFTETYSNA